MAKPRQKKFVVEIVVVAVESMGKKALKEAVQQAVEASPLMSGGGATRVRVRKVDVD